MTAYHGEKEERRKLLRHIERIAEIPMIILGFVWLSILVLEFTIGLNRALEKASIGIWIIFILHFTLSLFLAPDRKKFLRSNILTIVSLVVPAIRVLRIVRLFRLLRSVRLIRVLSSLNRGMRALTVTMKRRGFGYMLALTALVVFAGAAGMFAFERSHGGFNSYAEALWWTAIMVITVGSDYWPKSTEGRILCFMIALYGFAVLGYFTAMLASFFIGKDTQNSKLLENSRAEEIKTELTELKELIRTLNEKKQ